MVKNKGNGLFKQFRDVFSGRSQCRDVKLDQPLHLQKEAIRIALGDTPLEILLGENGKRLHLVAEEFIAMGDKPSAPAAPFFILYDDVFGCLAAGSQRHQELGIEEQQEDKHGPKDDEYPGD